MTRVSSLFFTVLLVIGFALPALAQQEEAKGGEAKESAEAASKTHVPSFLLVTTEQNVGVEPMAWWTSKTTPMGVAAINLGLVESVFTEVFREKGYRILDHQVLAGKIRIPEPLRIVQPSNKEAAAIGDLFTADYVLVGRAVATTGGEGVAGSAIASASATVSVRIISTKTAEIVATGQETATAMNANPQSAGASALKKAAERLAQKLIKAMNSKPGIKAFVID